MADEMAHPLYQPLHTAAHDGDGETIEIILAAGADVDVRSSDDFSALMIAAMAGQHAAAHQLVQGGADVKIHRDNGLTALHCAVDGETIEILLSSGADMDARDTGGHTPIMYATSKALPAAVQTLVAAGADVNVHRDSDGCTAFQIAVFAGHRESARVLVESGADSSMVSPGDGSTVLHFLAMQLAVDVDMVNVMLDAGVDADIHRDPDGLTTTHIASVRGHHLMVGVLSSSGADMDSRGTDDFTPLMYAVIHDQHAVAQTLLAAGADVNVRRASDGRTAFQLAAFYGHHESAKILLGSGADSSMCSPADDSTVLHFLVSLEEVDVDMVKVLLDAGVDADIHRGRDGCTPAHIAAIQGQRETVDALLSSGADMDALSANGLTPLMYAVMQDQHAVCQTLVASGVDANLVSDDRTALQLAALDGHHESARILLESGADSSIFPRGDGKSILYFLIFALPMDVDMVKVLLDAGADATAADDRGTTILHSLTMNQTVNEDVVGFLLDAGADPLAQDVDGRTPEDQLQQGEPHDGVRVLLRRSATWRRRRWVVMLRSRSGRNMEARVAKHRAGVITRSERKLSGAVEFLGLAPDGVFRLVVSFL